MICESWISGNDLADCDCPDASETVINDAILAASEILYALSGRQFSGICGETVRPCAEGSPLPGFAWSRWTYPWLPQRNGTTWINIGPACGCHIAFDCACGGIPQVNLGRSDVTEIIGVNIDGVALSASAYRLDHGQWLVRTDGANWPCCQDLSKEIGETGTWYIELNHGLAAPQSGKAAAKRLASELIKSCEGVACDLPQRVQTITRQGVSMTLLDPQDFLAEGRTGLYEVDLFIAAVNPHGLSRRATVWSPEVLGRGRRVGVIGS
jgi:hypothetical protein